MANQYEVIEQVQAVNTGIAAAAIENVISGTNKTDSFNHLEIINSDNVKIEVRLDGDSTRAYFIEAKTGFILDVTEGQNFKQVVQFNRDSATAETAGLIIFKAMKKKPVA